ncbi:MAG: tyrosine-type recombinase/integrase, partial [Sporichthyaceae bacterium]|nr:tyrosine-type recombinase/integrase [Sporichthyaceae bacterium]
MRRRSAIVVSGPLEPFADGFQVLLAERGYQPSSVEKRLRPVAQLSRWLGEHRFGPKELTESVVEQFLDEVASGSRYRRRTAGSALRQLLGYMRRLEVVAVPEPVAPSGPDELLMAAFGDYLVRERGIWSTTTTVRDYQRVGRLFVSAAVRPAGGWSGLTTAAVSQFVLGQCRDRSVRWGRLLVTALRWLLRFAYMEGHIGTDLSAAVPTVASWRGAGLPRAVDAAQVRRLLASCDRRSGAGRRDYAVLVLLARLGLRSGEVAALRCADVDWRDGQILVRGKADRQERLPLPCDVGQALAGYVCRGRPRRDNEHLFVQLRAPYTPLTAHAVRAIVARAADRAGLARLGAHRLRHTVATDMLAAGAPLAEIASVLRHRDT